MCKSPSYVWIEKGPRHVKQPVACGTCWQCRQTRTNDYVGRMLAEASTSDWTCCINLTYAPPDPERYQVDTIPLGHKVIYPPHVQKFIRSLRRRGHSLRYFVAGEYGDERARAHFHVILFGKGAKPKWLLPNDANAAPPYPNEFKDHAKARAEGRDHWPESRMFHLREWPHGHAVAQWHGGEKAMRYACKYLVKGEPGTYWFSLSKKPPLGAEYFATLAERNIALGVLPSSFEYVPPGGKPNQRYLMQGATRRDYLLRLVEGWQERRDLDDARLNAWVRERLEKTLRDQQISAAQDIDPDHYAALLMEELDRGRPSAKAVSLALARTSPDYYCNYSWTPEDG